MSNNIGDYILVICIVPIALSFSIELISTIFYKKFIGITPRERCTSVWTWIHARWNYIGGRPIQRHIGVRWFGFNFEVIYDIPYGELRF